MHGKEPGVMQMGVETPASSCLFLPYGPLKVELLLLETTNCDWDGWMRLGQG